MKKINISGGIGYDFTAEDFRRETQGETQDLELYINSGGGSIYEGFEIYNEMLSYRKRNNAKITVFYNGFVASAASYLSMGATERVAYDNSVFMIHNASLMIYGDSRVFNFWAEDLEKTDEVIALAYSKVTDKPIVEVRELMSAGQDNNGTYYYGDDIKQNGFADRLIESGEDLDKENALTQGKINFVNFKKNIKPDEYDHEKIVAMLKTPVVDTTGKNNKGETMTKEEILKGLLNLKENNGVALPEIAEHLNLSDKLITEDQMSKLNKFNEVVELLGEDPVAKINEMKGQIEENAADARELKLNEFFGDKEINGKENGARTFAETLIGDSELTEEKVNEVKENSVYKQLASLNADVDSDLNRVGKTNKVVESKPVEVVEY